MRKLVRENDLKLWHVTLESEKRMSPNGPITRPIVSANTPAHGTPMFGVETYPYKSSERYYKSDVRVALCALKYTL